MTFGAAWGLAAAAVAAGRAPCAAPGGAGPSRRDARWAGKAVLVPEPVPLTRDTVVDLAFLTKPVFTTERILAQARAGRIDLDAPPTSIVPGFRRYDAVCWERRATFRERLGHLTPFPAVELIYAYGAGPAARRAFVLQRDWRHAPEPSVRTSTSSSSASRWSGWRAVRSGGWTPGRDSHSRPSPRTAPRPRPVLGAAA